MHSPPGELHLTGKLALACAVLMVVSGVLWHGVTVENIQRIYKNLSERPGGAMSFRFVLQPLMAAIAGVRDGLKNPPFFRTLLRDKQHRMARLQEALNATARIMLLGLAIDVFYQITVLEMFYPVEAVLMPVLLAFLPYVLIQGPVMSAVRSAAKCIR
jgi:hypothetical protein